MLPKLVELTDRVLFDDVWERNELSKRDRSLITVAALIALTRPDQLRFHLGNAVETGVKKEELIEAEVITHLAFYSGWPHAMTSCGQKTRCGPSPPEKSRLFLINVSVSAAFNQPVVELPYYVGPIEELCNQGQNPKQNHHCHASRAPSL